MWLKSPARLETRYSPPRLMGLSPAAGVPARRRNSRGVSYLMNAVRTAPGDRLLHGWSAPEGLLTPFGSVAQCGTIARIQSKRRGSKMPGEPTPTTEFATGPLQRIGRCRCRTTSPRGCSRRRRRSSLKARAPIGPGVAQRGPRPPYICTNATAKTGNRVTSGERTVARIAAAQLAV
jgi:hypothetical protein